MQVKTKSVVVAVILLGFYQKGFTQSAEQIIEERTVEYHRLYTDEKGESHFDAGYFDLKSKPYTPPTIPFSLTFKMEMNDSSRILMVPAGRFLAWHPAPAKQYMISVKGVYEIEASDGEKKVINPGEILLLEDTSGIGHQTKVIGNEDLLVVVIPIK